MITPNFRDSQGLEECLAQTNPFRTLRFLYYGYRWSFLGAVLCYLPKQSPVWLIPLVLANAIDRLTHRSANDFFAISRNSGILVALLLLALPLNRLYVHLLAKSQRKIEIQLRVAVCERLHLLNMENFLGQSAGLIQSKLVRDVEAIGLLTRTLYEGVLSNVINLFFALAVIGLRHGIFFFLLILLVPFTVFSVRSLAGPLAKKSANFRIKIEFLSAKISSMFTIIPIARAHGAEETTSAALQEEFKSVHAAGLKLDQAYALFGTLSWITLQLVYILCFTTAILASVKNVVEVTPGEIMLTSAYFLLITNSTLAFISMLPALTSGIESIRSIGEMFQHSEVELNEGKPKISELEGEISFENVDFRYKNSDKLAISGMSFHIRAGETVALIGRSGGGKSTAVKLILGFLRPASGRVLIDGRDLAKTNLKSYRKFISLVPQELALFNGTIAENVAFGCPGASIEDIREALKQANAMEFISLFPKGILSSVGENGSLLSGGQRQRLAIAAALIRNPRILILDEATSALDRESEAAVQEALKRIMKGRTCIVIAHRPSTVALANRIFSLEDGRLVENGSREDLLQSDGLFSALFRATSFL